MRAPFSFLHNATPAFNPATLAFSGWWKGDDYDGSNTWTRKASAGTSGSGTGRNFIHSPANVAPSAPALGGGLGGHQTVAFSRAGHTGLTTGFAIPSFISVADVWTVAALVNIIDIVSNNSGANSYLNEQILGEAGGYWGMMLKATGSKVQAATYPATPPDVAFTLGAWQFLQARGISGGHTEVRVNGGSWTNVAANAIGSLAQILEIGFTSQNPSYINGEIAEAFIADQTMSDGDLDNYRGYLHSEYGVTV